MAKKLKVTVTIDIESGYQKAYSTQYLMEGAIEAGMKSLGPSLIEVIDTRVDIEEVDS